MRSKKSLVESGRPDFFRTSPSAETSKRHLAQLIDYFHTTTEFNFVWHQWLALDLREVDPVQPAGQVRLGHVTSACNAFHNKWLRSSNPVTTFTAVSRTIFRDRRATDE
jgi:hypothetical protein